ncbi:MAG: DUF1441 family protein [Desulfurellales bacterium]|jgi:hypothetical protein|nr:MAG: DUF1441 family protein [Desulfurellales bacterium]
MGAVIETADGLVRLSIARLAAEFGMARETVSKRLAQANVQPDGKRGGYPVYRLRDACPALIDGGHAEGDEGVDPSKMKPSDRRAWFQSENERLKFEQETGQLILAAEVHAEFAAAAKVVVRELETLPDRAERDLRCSPEVVEYLQAEVRNIRTEIAKHLATDDEEDARISA